MESPLLLWPTTMRPSQRPSSRFRTMPSPDGLRFAISVTSEIFIFDLRCSFWVSHLIGGYL